MLGATVESQCFIFSCFMLVESFINNNSSFCYEITVVLYLYGRFDSIRTVNSGQGAPVNVLFVDGRFDSIRTVNSGQGAPVNVFFVDGRFDSIRTVNTGQGVPVNVFFVDGRFDSIRTVNTGQGAPVNVFFVDVSMCQSDESFFVYARF